MDNSIKITVITVCFNSEKTILDTINSVFSQKFENYEHLIIDGGSNDGTLDLVKSNLNGKIKLFSGKDDGIYDAMNKGFSLSTGDVIGFLNSDDYLADEFVFNRINDNFISSKEIEACFSDLVYVDPIYCKPVRYWKSCTFKPGMFSKGWSPAHPTFYIRRSALNRLGLFNLSFRLASDAEFMMRYLESGLVKSNYIPNVNVIMRLGGATNKNISNIIAQNFEIFQAMKINNIKFSPFLYLMYKIIDRIKQRMRFI